MKELGVAIDEQPLLRLPPRAFEALGEMGDVRASTRPEIDDPEPAGGAPATPEVFQAAVQHRSGASRFVECEPERQPVGRSAPMREPGPHP